VSSGPISGAEDEISGNFDVTETKDLANDVLRAGNFLPQQILFNQKL
jgi:SecD/SecF fusion protein